MLRSPLPPPLLLLLLLFLCVAATPKGYDLGTVSSLALVSVHQLYLVRKGVQARTVWHNIVSRLCAREQDGC
jgi:hypothetical protein